MWQGSGSHHLRSERPQTCRLAGHHQRRTNRQQIVPDTICTVTWQDTQSRCCWVPLPLRVRGDNLLWTRGSLKERPHAWGRVMDTNNGWMSAYWEGWMNGRFPNASRLLSEVWNVTAAEMFTKPCKFVVADCLRSCSFQCFSKTLYKASCHYGTCHY